ncbi:hypothetical protein [Vibrio salinus]|uniref:hypothetical protein n=1 Tax=Vibrio salinus TaxID=2899784 RepID=UPI001E44019F|nr:hypothetical protein [Vibrio salinus]MCE0495625.1 hypothetical protein [Vibrio salinus]
MSIHPDLHSIDSMKSVTLKASQAITINVDRFLFLYTERCDDFTLLAEGLNEGEDFILWI